MATHAIARAGKHAREQAFAPQEHARSKGHHVGVQAGVPSRPRPVRQLPARETSALRQPRLCVQRRMLLWEPACGQTAGGPRTGACLDR